MSKRTLISLLMACAPLMLGSSASPGAEAATPAPVTYSQVHAVFVKHCLSCHDRKEAEGELVMESFESLMKGGDAGAEVVPGKADESRLVKYVVNASSRKRSTSAAEQYFVGSGRVSTACWE